MSNIFFYYRLTLFLILCDINNGAGVNDNPYGITQHHVSSGSNIDTAYSARMHYQQQSEQNVQGNSNYQQFYHYYYNPTRYQQQHQFQTVQQSIQLWSGPHIIFEETIHQPSTPNHEQRDIPTNNNSLLLTVRKNSKALPSVYNPQITQLNYTNLTNNNNNNIVYHKDFRQQIAVIPETKHMQQDDTVTKNNWLQQQHQYYYQQLLEERQKCHQQQQYPSYAINKNLHYNGISNDLNSLGKDNIPDYREHFRLYLENNPHRIKPIY